MDPSDSLYLMLPSAIIFAFTFFLASNKEVPGFSIPSSTSEPKGTLGLDLLFSIVSRKLSSITFVLLILLLAASKYFFLFQSRNNFSLIFLQQQLLFRCQKGSNILSPLFVVANIILWSKDSGFE